MTKKGGTQERRFMGVRDVPTDAIRRLRIQAAFEGRAQGEIIADAIRVYCKANRKGGKK